jgi:hypothetical protein
MIGEPVASARDLQRYERLLVEKRSDLSSAPGEAHSRVPAAGACTEICLTRPTPMPKRSFRSASTKQVVVSYEQSKSQSLGSSRVPTGYVRSASSLSLRLVWKRCLGRISAVSARNASAQPPNGGERTDIQPSMS